MVLEKKCQTKILYKYFLKNNYQCQLSIVYLFLSLLH